MLLMTDQVDGDQASVPLAVAPKDIELRRRDLLARLGRAAGYAAPVSVALLNMKAGASSATC
jgi:hypothetical protein